MDVEILLHLGDLLVARLWIFLEHLADQSRKAIGDRGTKLLQGLERFGGENPANPVSWTLRPVELLETLQAQDGLLGQEAEGI